MAQAMTAAGWGDEARPSASWAVATVLATFTAEEPSELSVAEGAPNKMGGMDMVYMAYMDMDMAYMDMVTGEILRLPPP